MTRSMIHKLLAAATTAAIIGSASAAMAAPRHHAHPLVPGAPLYSSAPLTMVPGYHHSGPTADVYDHAKGDIKDH